MSVLSYGKVLDVPFTDDAVRKMIGKMEQVQSYVSAAASATQTLGQMTFDGEIGDVYAIIGTVTNQGDENMTIDIQKNGSTVLTGVLTLDNTADKKQQIKFSVDKTKNSFVKGDVFTCVRTYTPGAAALPMKDVTVVLEPSIGQYISN